MMSFLTTTFEVRGTCSTRYQRGRYSPKPLRFQLLEEDAHRVLELPEISSVLAQDGLGALLEASHPLVVAVVCDVGLPHQR